MRRSHFDELHPVCPVCRQSALAISSVIREFEGDVLEGILVCGNAECRREYPIIDAIPVIVGAIRAWLTANPLQILTRRDLSSDIESLLGDVLGPESPFDVQRQQVGMYTSDHYDSEPEGGSAAAVLERGLGSLRLSIDGPCLDVGCSVGRTTFALAGRLRRPTVGIDLNFAMLRVASDALRDQRVRYARRSVGLVYEHRDIGLRMPARELVDFWCCDATALPFSDATFAVTSSINVVDCLSSPATGIAELTRVTRPGGLAIVSTPYDWSPGATPVEQWLGGHSQRSESRGASEPVLRSLMSRHFEIIDEDAHVPWHVRLHDRATAQYDVHVVVGRLHR